MADNNGTLAENEASVQGEYAKFNRWSRVMIGIMIRETEQKMIESDLPVEPDRGDNFWTEVAR